MSLGNDLAAILAGTGGEVSGAYMGYASGSNLDFSGVAFDAAIASPVPIVTPGSWTDVLQDGITRLGSDFTFVDGGRYIFRASAGLATGGTTKYYAFRLQDVAGAVTWAQEGLALNGTTLAVLTMYAILDGVPAGKVLRLQYARQNVGAAAVYGAGTVDGVSVRNFSVACHRIGTL